VGWERGETFLGEYFPDADEAIDSWPDAGSGFHAIEPLLFEAGDVAGAKALSERLLIEIEALRDDFATQELDAQGLANGMTGIAYEIGEAKAGGGDRRLPAPRSWTCVTTFRASRRCTLWSSRARSSSRIRPCISGSWRAWSSSAARLARPPSRP
jgi:hypothetical protein